MHDEHRELWSSAVDDEVRFWRRTIEADPGRFQRRFERERPDNEFLPELVRILDRSATSILDVGCGPAPVVLGNYDRPVSIVACDPLADSYRDLLTQYRVDTAVEFVKAEGEKLLDSFEEQSFDITHIRNALDHSYNPMAVLESMMACTKEGGAVIVRTLINTGALENYHGLHQWDLFPGAGDLYMRHRDGETSSLREVLGSKAAMVLVGLHAGSHYDTVQDWCDVVVVREGASEELLGRIEAGFYRSQIQLLREGERRLHRLRAERDRLKAELARRPEPASNGDSGDSVDMRSSLAHALGEKARLEVLLAEKKRELRRLRGVEQDRARLERSLSYRLGKALFDAKSSPRELGALPIRLAGIAAESRRRRKRRRLKKKS